MSEAKLREIFRTVGKEYGFEDVDAEYMATKEFKIKWTRSRGRADFRVCDYLEDAEEKVIEGVAKTLFSKISGRDLEYPDELTEWMTKESFVRSKQPVYLRRSRNLTKTTKGNSRDLKGSYDRLVKAGLIPEDPDVHISWTIEPNLKRVGYCSVLMKVIAISSVFDSELIPEFVLDYVVYHEALHVMAGFEPFRKKHGAEFQKNEGKHPQSEEAEAWLKKLCLYF